MYEKRKGKTHKTKRVGTNNKRKNERKNDGQKGRKTEIKKQQKKQ